MGACLAVSISGETPATLRFNVGQKVEVHMADGWVLGTVAKLWAKPEGYDGELPYEVNLDAGGLAHAMDDSNANIREEGLRRAASFPSRILRDNELPSPIFST